MSFYAIRDNKILAKISEFTVLWIYSPGIERHREYVIAFRGFCPSVHSVMLYVSPPIILKMLNNLLSQTWAVQRHIYFQTFHPGTLERDR